MIVSHRHGYIFIKSPKTAGTSLEIALSRYCGPRDIITPISPVDEETRRELGGISPQNFLVPRSRWRPRDWAKWVLRRGVPRFYNHASAEYIRRYLPRDVWSSYFKFAFERNPWDRTISRYYWDHRSEPRPLLAKYIETELPSKRRGWNLYTIDGEIVVDRVYRYEELEDSLTDLVSRFGFEDGLRLPRSKAGHRPDQTDRSQVMGPSEREQIARLFADEIDALDYSFRE